MASFTFDEATHTYAIDGVRLPSVTEIIKPLSPDWSMVDASILEAKRALGVAVHLACELSDSGELDEQSTDATVMQYVDSWRSFLSHTGAAVVANERRMFHPMLRFAGTIDRVIQMPDGKTLVVDIKTASDAHPSYGVQLAGYELLLSMDSSLRIDGRATVHLAEGGYRLHMHTDPNDHPAFMGCLSILQWKESHK